MTEKEVKAAADEIVLKFEPHSAYTYSQSYESNIDAKGVVKNTVSVGDLKEGRQLSATHCAIIAVRFAKDRTPMYTGNLNPKWKELDAIETELKSRL